ncbi:hypothetical protein ACJX0J_025566, partial [Zea mays]
MCTLLDHVTCGYSIGDGNMGMLCTMLIETDYLTFILLSSRLSELIDELSFEVHLLINSHILLRWFHVFEDSNEMLGKINEDYKNLALADAWGPVAGEAHTDITVHPWSDIGKKIWHKFGSIDDVAISMQECQ